MIIDVMIGYFKCHVVTDLWFIDLRVEGEVMKMCRLNGWATIRLLLWGT